MAKKKGSRGSGIAAAAAMTKAASTAVLANPQVEKMRLTREKKRQQQLRESDELLKGKFGPLHEIRVFKREYKAYYPDGGERGPEEEGDDDESSMDDEAEDDDDVEDDEVSQPGTRAANGTSAMQESSDDDLDDDDEQQRRRGASKRQSTDAAASSTVAGKAASQGLMKCFWELASLTASTRIQAGAAVIALLKQSQETFDGDADLCPDIEYSLKRLVRGMGSSRKAARQGFGIVLTELLSAFPQIPVAKVLSLTKKMHKLTSGASKREARECQYGRLFIYAALIQSGAVARTGDNAPASGAVATITEHLLSVADFKNYMSPPATQVLCQLISSVPSDVYCKEVHPAIAPRLLPSKPTAPKKNKKGKQASTSGSAAAATKEPALSPQAVCLLLASRRHFEAINSGDVKLPTKLSKQTLRDRLAFVHFNSDKLSMFEAPMLEAQLMSPLWVMLAEALAPLPESSFVVAWSALVNDTLLNKQHIRNWRRAVAFSLIRLIAPSAPQKMHVMLSDAIMSMLMLNLTSPTKYLHGAANAVVRALVQTAQQEDVPPNVRLDLLARLTGPKGSRKFDVVTSTKTINTILTTLTREEVSTYVLQLQQHFNNPRVNLSNKGSDEDLVEELVTKHREFALDQMFALLRNARVPKREDWAMGCLAFCMVHACFDANNTMESVRKAIGDTADAMALEEKQHELSEDTLKACKDRFLSFMSDLCSAMPYEAVPESQQPRSGCRADGTHRIDAIVAIMRSLLDTVPLLEPLEDDVQEAFADLVKLQQELETVVAGKKMPKSASKETKASLQHAAKAFSFLVLHTMSMVMTDGAALVRSGPDLRGAYTDLKRRIVDGDAKATKKGKRTSKKGQGKQSQDEGNEDDSVDPTAVVVDVMLSMSAHESSLLRAVVGKAFSMLCDSMTDGAIQLICDVITDTNPMSQEDEEGSGEEDETEDMEEKEDGSDESDESGSDDESDSEDASDDDEADSDDDEEDEDEATTSEEQLQKLRAKVGRALDMPVDEQGNLQEQAEEPDSDWDDEQMMAVDAQLAAVFRQHVGKRTNKKQLQRENQRFRLRVLDLAEIYMRKRSTSPSIIYFIPALLKAHNASVLLKKADQPLVDRLHSLMRNKLPQLKSLPTLTSDHHIALAEEALELAVDIAVQGQDKAQRSMGAAVARVLLRIFTHGAANVTGKGDERRVGQLRCQLFEKLYGGAVRLFLTKNTSRHDLAMVTDLMGAFQALVWLLVPTLSEHIKDCRKPLRLEHAIALLTKTLRQRKFLQEHPDLVKSHASDLVKFFENGMAAISVKGRNKMVRSFLQSMVLAVHILKDADEDVNSLLVLARKLASSKFAVESPSVFTVAKQVLRDGGEDVGEMARPDVAQPLEAAKATKTKQKKNKQQKENKQKQTGQKKKAGGEENQNADTPKKAQNKGSTASNKGRKDGKRSARTAKSTNKKTKKA